MKYTWSCEANDLIDALEKRGFSKIGHFPNQYDFGTLYFSNVNKIEELNDTNLVIVKRKPTHTMVEFPANFKKEEIEKIHAETVAKTKELGFARHWAVLMWNKKTNEYKFLYLQPMFVMRILMQLGVFDYSDVIKKLKFNKKDSQDSKYEKFVEYLKKQKFTGESQAFAEFNITDSKGSIRYQLEQHFGQDWEYIGPKRQYAKVEQEVVDESDHSDALLMKSRVIFGHGGDFEQDEINTYNYLNSKKLWKEFNEFFKKEQKKSKDAKYFDCLKKFEEKIGFEIPLFMLNFWEDWEKEGD